MNTIICNKCFAGLHRGKQPYSLTECGHIYCQICANQGECNQSTSAQTGVKCPQCQQTGVVSIPLKEPQHLSPQISRLFTSVTDALTDLHKTCSFQENQAKILAQRFVEMDTKYEIIKTQYHKICRYSKTITEKYKAEKARREELETKLAWNLQCSEASLPSHDSTPMHRGNGVINRTLNIENYMITPRTNMSSDTSKNYPSSDGFRIPYHRAPRSSEPRRNTTTTPQYSFRNIHN